MKKILAIIAILIIAIIGYSIYYSIASWPDLALLVTLFIGVVWTIFKWDKNLAEKGGE